MTSWRGRWVYLHLLLRRSLVFEGRKLGAVMGDQMDMTYWPWSAVGFCLYIGAFNLVWPRMSETYFPAYKLMERSKQLMWNSSWVHLHLNSLLGNFLASLCYHQVLVKISVILLQNLSSWISVLLLDSSCTLKCMPLMKASVSPSGADHCIDPHHVTMYMWLTSYKHPVWVTAHRCFLTTGFTTLYFFVMWSPNYYLSLLSPRKKRRLKLHTSSVDKFFLSRGGLWSSEAYVMVDICSLFT